MKQRIKTVPDLSLSSPTHQEAISSGTDDHLWRWTRNVIDDYKELSNDQIKQKLKETSFPYAVCFENWAHDFNCSSLIRNANAFNAREVFYIGDKKFDKRGAVGCFNYTDVTWLPTVNDFLNLKNTYHVIGVDNIPGAKPIQEIKYQPYTLFVFGSEGVGITPEMQSMCDEMLYIPQYGSVRSLNAATASGIIMFDYTSKVGRA